MPRASLLHLESSIDHATRPSRASDGTGTISQLSKTSFIVSGQRAAFLACIFDSVSVSCACRSKTRRDRCREIARRAGFGFFRVLNYEELRDLIDVPHTRMCSPVSPHEAGPMNLSENHPKLVGTRYTGIYGSAVRLGQAATEWTARVTATTD